MKTNLKKSYAAKTFGGSPAVANVSALNQLRRSVLSTLLWEDQFYEDGKTIASRIDELASKVSKKDLMKLAVEARTEHNLRHVPLLLLKTLISKGGEGVSGTIYDTIQRADELAELVSLYWKDGKRPLSAQMKKGLAKAFTKFSPYQLAKYNRDGAVKLRDVLFLSHAKPLNDKQAATWKQLVDGTLPTPDTWEVALSTGQNKKASWERLLSEGKLGYFALLRNLRNMVAVGVDSSLINKALLARDTGVEKILPFRFISAAKAAPRFTGVLSDVMVANASAAPKLRGKTVIVVDISGSMGAMLSSKSELNRLDAACALAAIAREQCEEVVIYATAGDDLRCLHATAEVPAYRGLALADAIPNMRHTHRLGGGGIFLTPVMRWIAERESGVTRTIVVTDEQDCAGAGANSPSLAQPLGAGYLINVASARNGIGYGKWTTINGFSENVIKYIQEVEKLN